MQKKGAIPSHLVELLLVLRALEIDLTHENIVRLHDVMLTVGAKPVGRKNAQKTLKKTTHKNTKIRQKV